MISGNLVHEEVFARGIYPAGVANVTITGNMTEATNQNGILLEQDEGLNYNYKTGPSSGIVIKNNIVDHALGYGIPSNNLLGFAGAINVVAYDEHFARVSTNSLSNIAITGNFVANSAGGNTVLNYARSPTTTCGICRIVARLWPRCRRTSSSRSWSPTAPR